MIVSLVITLYTSRVILATLGQDDFGIYNVVGGVVVLFSFLTNAMTVSTQRFLNYNIGLGDEKKVSSIFNTVTLAHYTILLIVLVLSETIGLWFVETQLNIPSDRMIAARWVYQMSILATLVNIIVIPYRASIISTEKMDIFAYISILEVVLKLVIVLVLPFFMMDRLILYSVLLSGISFVSYFLYRTICNRKLTFTHFHFEWNKQQFKEIMSFSGWYLFGGVAMVGSKQGVNILINIFFNVAVNAAVGIANQVRNAVFGFVTSFQTAFNPQIVKLYAANEQNRLIQLIYRSTKFSYYLLLILSLPIIIYCEEILSLWLVEVPNYAVIFTQLVIVSSFFEALSAPLWTAIGATGDVKMYQFWVSLIILLDIPIVYIFLKMGMGPTIVFVITIVVNFFAYIFRLIYIRKYVRYSFLSYLKDVICPCATVSAASIPISYLLSNYGGPSVYSLLFMVVLSVTITAASIYFFGLKKNEKTFIMGIITKRLNKYFCK